VQEVVKKARTLAWLIAHKSGKEIEGTEMGKDIRSRSTNSKHRQ
jgi:hypothetical protein